VIDYAVRICPVTLKKCCSCYCPFDEKNGVPCDLKNKKTEVLK